jgi:amino acid adenylation domain-containing protein
VLTPGIRTQLAERKAEIIEFLGRSTSAPLDDILPLQPASRDGHIAASFAQQRLLFLEQFAPGNSTFNLADFFRLKGKLNIDALEQSLIEIVRRHEGLRTTFSWVDDQPVQHISSVEAFKLVVEDLQGALDVQVQQRMRTVMEEPFDLFRGPLFRAVLLRVAAEEHLLCLVVHHIIFDGWSLGILRQELQQLYRATVTGEPCSLPEPSIQYADFAFSQRQWLQGQVLERELAYWKHALGGKLPVLELPMARPRPALQSYRGHTYEFVLPAILLQKLKALCQQEGVTLYMALLAAFKVLLYRYSQQEDILVGTPVSNRSRVELEGVIGCFVNTLVIRTLFSDDPPFREVLRRVRSKTLEAYAHQNLPFERLVEELSPERSLSHPPVFQVMFVLLVPQQPLALEELEVSEIRIPRTTSELDLSLHMREEADGLYGIFQYNRDLYDAETITGFVSHLQTLLESIVADPDRKVSRLPLLTGTERRQVLQLWNDTAADYPRDQCLHQLFEAQVERTPAAIAVAFADKKLTYQELNRRANQLARHLHDMGVGDGSLVALCLERSLEMLVAMLGVLKSGAAYLPLDPAYPPARRTYMMEDAQVSVLITQKQLLDALPPTDAQALCLDTDWEVIARHSGANLSSDIPTDMTGETSSEARAYVIYTSGSTGVPKGVEVLHRGVVNFLWSMRAQPGISEQDVMLAVTTLSFDIAVLELFLPLITGAQVVIVSREVASDGDQLARAITESRATMMQATPATWRLLLEAGWTGSPRLTVLCGGEALPLELARELQERSAALWNMYGPTETTIWSTVERVHAGAGAISIGRPIANTQLYLLDKHLEPVPVGVVGNLYIGGDGLARGYLKRPELTAERFVKNPFSQGEARMYKTGDLARYLGDGRVLFLGRSDHQVKLRGHRIELGEIEALLEEHPAVRQAVAAVRAESDGDQRLVAYVTPAAERPLAAAQLRSFLQQKLPDYMLPSHYVELDEVPLTPNGKVDRQALPAPDGARPELEASYVAARTPLEETIVGLWQDVLKIEQVGIHDNFFDLGGYSLLAIKLVSRLCDALQINLPPHIIFGRRTVAELAMAVVEHEVQQVDEATLAELIAGLEAQ